MTLPALVYTSCRQCGATVVYRPPAGPTDGYCGDCYIRYSKYPDWRPQMPLRVLGKR